MGLKRETWTASVVYEKEQVDKVYSNIKGAPHDDANKESGTMTTRLVGASRGDPYDPHSVSGVPYYLFNALARRYGMVERIDTRLSRWQTGRVALQTFHPVRARWQERYFKNLPALELQSRNSRTQLTQITQPYDVVMQVYGLFRTMGAPYVMYIDNTHRQSVEEWPEWNPLRGKQLERWYAFEQATYAGALHLFTMGEPARQALLTFYNIPPERVTNVGGGVNFDHLPTLQPPEHEREPVILFVGREYRRKGGDLLVDAFRQVRAQMPNARLQIVGTTEAPHEPGVEVLGTINNRQQIADLYARAQVFCLPTRFEPYGLVLAEAMAYGLPCVGTNICAVPEIVLHEQTGLVVPRDDSQALAAALLRVLRHPNDASQMGRAGRRRVEQCINWDGVVARMAPVLDALGQHVAAQPAASMRGDYAGAYHSPPPVETY